MIKSAFFLLTFFVFACAPRTVSQSVSKKSINVIAYYAGNAENIDKFPVEKLTHIIYSFLHLRGNKLSVDNDRDSATIKKLVSLKSRNPNLKIMLALGGWGGCKSCSDVFNDPAGRKEFLESTKELNDYFKTDGIDLDWEYPTIPGYEGHPYRPEDKQNFTSLVKGLRETLGPDQEISFAAGGTDRFLKESVDWDALAPLIDRVNLMSYDLVSGGSTVTGHLTNLYSTPEQKSSADYAIRFLTDRGFPANKIVIGAAFYARTWLNHEPSEDGKYQKGQFKNFIGWNRLMTIISKDSGYVHYRDPVAQAPYAYHPQKRMYATYDDEISIAMKTQYAINKGLDGIMFWELSIDKPTGGLLDAIDRERKKQ